MERHSHRVGPVSAPVPIAVMSAIDGGHYQRQADARSNIRQLEGVERVSMILTFPVQAYE
ncbi:MAG: hypothetical protein ACR2JX_08000 [Mycobacteriales bacterium]